MSFRGDFYEAYTWAALEELFPGRVTYEPQRSIHNCQHSCRYRASCVKPNTYEELIYTVPDFLVHDENLTFFLVCYWDSKETSHAKFWRTLSELADIKRYVPQAFSTCVVYEARFSDGEYTADGWYPHFLEAFHRMFDSCVFFDDTHLLADVSEAADHLKGRSGAKYIYDKYMSNFEPATFRQLVRAFRTPLAQPTKDQALFSKLWPKEIGECSQVSAKEFSAHTGQRFRNALLQLSLLALLKGSTADLHGFVNSLYRSIESIDESELFLLLKRASKLPIEYRNEEYTFLVRSVEEDMVGELQCSFSEDVDWLLEAFANDRLPLASADAIAVLERLVKEFLSSSQVAEAVNTLNDGVCAQTLDDLISMSADDLWDAYQRVPDGNDYNVVAELLISATGFGTYPLCRAINSRNKRIGANRNDIRSLYSNKRLVTKASRQKTILREIANCVPETLDYDEIILQYQLRKTRRVVGSQSAINPFEIALDVLLSNLRLAENTLLVRGKEIKTLVSDLAESEQAGNWRLAMSFEQDRQTIPLFFSAMKSPTDCRHKTREFKAHIVAAKYSVRGDNIVRNRLQRGIAVLEGGYDQRDKLAFHLSGFDVCSLDSFTELLEERGLIETD